MTTPIERAVEALIAKSLTDDNAVARAVFESIDREGLAKAALEGLRDTKHGYRFNPEVAATSIRDWLLSEGGA